MAKGICPTCDTLQGITTTSQPITPRDTGSARRWRIDLHKHPDRPELCDGSGRLV